LAGRAGLIWAPRVLDGQRAAFGMPILERAADGALIPSRRREQYFPLVYVEPERSGVRRGPCKASGKSATMRG
jgi:hypothetical protein